MNFFSINNHLQSAFFYVIVSKYFNRKRISLFIIKVLVSHPKKNDDKQNFYDDQT